MEHIKNLEKDNIDEEKRLKNKEKKFNLALEEKEYEVQDYCTKYNDMKDAFDA